MLDGLFSVQVRCGQTTLPIPVKIFLYMLLYLEGIFIRGYPYLRNL